MKLGPRFYETIAFRMSWAEFVIMVMVTQGNVIKSLIAVDSIWYHIIKSLLKRVTWLPIFMIIDHFSFILPRKMVRIMLQQPGEEEKEK